MADRWGSVAAAALTLLAAPRAALPLPAPAIAPAGPRTGPEPGHEPTPRVPTEAPAVRTIVTTDVEIDDVASFHRLLLYANELDLAGVVTSSSEFHWAGDRRAVPPVAPRAWDRWPDLVPGRRRAEVLHDVVAAGYAPAYPHLRRQDARYPSPERLLGLLATGNVTAPGEMGADTAGSELVKAALLDDDDRPLWLQVWGGTNTVAAALRSIGDEFGRTPRWRDVRRRVLAKAWLYVIGDQDVTYKHYVRAAWPGLRTVLNRDQFWPLGYRFGRIGARRPPAEEPYLGAAAMRRVARGPLLGGYPVGPVFLEPRRGTFVGEADSPAFLHLLPTGLRSVENPAWGGWGGRFVPTATPGVWSDCPGYADAPRYSSILTVRGRRSGRDPTRTRDDGDARRPQARWVPALQNDLIARAGWQAGDAVTRHPPVVHVPAELREVTVRPGGTVELHAEVADPDGVGVQVRWWHYREAGTHPGPVVLAGERLVVPAARPGATIHLVCEATGAGDPPLTRYGRVVVTVG
ncbi:MAG: DUF1593 domain-containing protein [Pseudonocardia sp.]